MLDVIRVISELSVWNLLLHTSPPWCRYPCQHLDISLTVQFLGYTPKVPFALVLKRLLLIRVYGVDLVLLGSVSIAIALIVSL